MFQSCRLSLASLLTCCILLLTGCSASVTDHELPAGSTTATATENVRVWLEGVAERGELDSGISLMGDEVEKMKADGVTNTEEIHKALDELEAQKSPSAIKAKAKAALELLPKA